MQRADYVKPDKGGRMAETVLIIDDQRENVEFLTEGFLGPAGYHLSVAYNGEEGLQKALEIQPDLVILNLTVPKMGGLQVLEELRQSNQDLPVILMAFHGSEQAAVRALQLGAQDYVLKPCTVERIRQAVERGLTVRRLRRERDRLAKVAARANNEMERRLRELSILSSIGKTVTALLDEDRVLTRVVEAAVYITGAEEGFLLLIDEHSGELYIRAARGLGEKYAREFRLKVDDSLAGKVVQTGKPLVVSASHQEQGFKLKTGYLVRSLLHVPVKVADSVIGVLSVDNMLEERTFDDHDLYLLSTLADYAAIALENSRLHARLQRGPPRQHSALTAIGSTSAAAPGTESSNGIPSHQPAGQIRTHLAESGLGMDTGSHILSALREQIVAFEAWLGRMGTEQQGMHQDLSVSPEAGSPSPNTLVERELARVLDHVTDGLIAIDDHGTVTMANLAARAILGDEIVAKSVDEVCEDPRWTKTYRIVKAAAQFAEEMPGSELSGANTPLFIDNKRIRASFRISPSTDHSQLAMVVVLSDVTTEREARRARDTLVDSAYQELRSPITAISGYVELLLDSLVGQLNEPQADFLKRIQRNAEHSCALLNDLTGMAATDSTQLEIRKETIELMSAVREAVNAVRPQLATRDQAVNLDLDPRLPFVQISPDALYYVLTNLLLNAHRCSREAARVTLRAQKMRQDDSFHAVVSVTDSGGGIAPQDHKKVFNRYYRAESPEVPGLGDPLLTLPIVKVLVEAHGGRLWMDTEPGVGTTFAVVLPARLGT